ncbi:MAG: hypothetical protein ABEJ43_08500 [Haloferacaceae archaeon]
MASDTTVAAAAALAVTASFPCYLLGAKVMIDAEVVTWNVLRRHLKFIVTGLVLNTVPVVGWMMPRLLEQLNGAAALHAVLGLQAYAMLLFGLTGIVRILQVKLAADAYDDPDAVALDDLHENMGAWRGRLRVGVFGYVLFWMLAYVVGIYRFWARYLA